MNGLKPNVNKLEKVLARTGQLIYLLGAQCAYKDAYLKYTYFWRSIREIAAAWYLARLKAINFTSLHGRRRHEAR